MGRRTPLSHVAAIIGLTAASAGLWRHLMGGRCAPEAVQLAHLTPAPVLPTSNRVPSHQRRGLLGTSLAVVAAREPARAEAGASAVKLRNGLSFPTASFGLQVYDDGTAQRLTETAISVGYRNFFASVLAGNQKGFAKGVQASGVPRSELFICGTVLSNRARGFDRAYEATKRGCDDNLKALSAGGITYVDMIMLDYPGPDCDSIKGQWKAFEEMLAAGATKSLAVSNFSPDQLDCLLGDAKATPPTVNQLPYSINYHDPAAVEANRERGVVVQAWAPLGGSTGGISRKAKKLCADIGAAYGKSWAQVALRWIVETGATYSTQTRSREHFVEDLNIFDFNLSSEDMAKLAAV